MSIEKIAAIIKKAVKVFVLVGIVAGIVMGMKYWQKSRGWYDSSAGPSESYQEAKLQHNASLASLFDFQLSVNGYYFTVPMRYGEIREMGCKDYPGVDMLDPGETLSNGSWFILGEPNAEEINPLKDRTAIWAEVHNYSEEQISIDECIITGLIVGKFKEPGNFEVVLPKGIKIGEADTNEVKKAYGNPKYEEQEPVTERYVFKYEMSGSATKSYVVFHFDDEGILAKVEFYNKREDYGTSIK